MRAQRSRAWAFPPLRAGLSGKEEAQDIPSPAAGRGPGDRRSHHRSGDAASGGESRSEGEGGSTRRLLRKYPLTLAATCGSQLPEPLRSPGLSPPAGRGEPRALYLSPDSPAAERGEGLRAATVANSATHSNRPWTMIRPAGLPDEASRDRTLKAPSTARPPRRVRLRRRILDVEHPHHPVLRPAWRSAWSECPCRTRCRPCRGRAPWRSRRCRRPGTRCPRRRSTSTRRRARTRR